MQLVHQRPSQQVRLARISVWHQGADWQAVSPRVNPPQAFARHSQRLLDSGVKCGGRMGEIAPATEMGTYAVDIA